MTYTARDLDDLAAFRRAASQVREATIIAKGEQVRMHGHRGSDGKLEVTPTLLDRERFRSLALSVRLVYQSNEPANFGHICNILARSGDSVLSSRAAALRSAYNQTLEDHSLFTAIALAEKDSYSPRDAFEAWLYHGVFHQDQSRRADYEAFASVGDRFEAAVQSVALLLAGRIMDLDDVIADVLQQERLPRIAASPESGQTSN